MPILYGVGRTAAIAAVLLYEAVGLLFLLIGGVLAYLFLRREFGPMNSVRDGPRPAAQAAGWAARRTRRISDTEVFSARGRARTRLVP
jgi:hypothetical protein